MPLAAVLSVCGPPTSGCRRKSQQICSKTCRECQRFVAALWTRRMIVETWFLMITDIHKLSDLINEAFLMKIILRARRGSQSPLDDQTLILANWSLLNSQRFVRAVAALRGRRGTKQAQDKFLLESDDLTNEGFFRIPSLSVKIFITSFLPNSYEFLIFHQLCLQNTKYWRKRNKNSRNHPKSVSIVSLFHYCVIIICVMLIIDILEWNPEVLEILFRDTFWTRFVLISVQRAHVLTMLAKWVFGSDGVPKD